MPAKTGNKRTPQSAQATRRESPEPLPDPFKRSKRIQRSPEQLVGNHTQVRSQSFPPILQEKTLMTRKSENSFVELGEKIGELIEMMAPTPSAPARHTTHQPMRDLVDILAVLHKKAAIELGNQMAKKAVTDGTTQTEKGGRVNARKRLRGQGSADTTPAKKSVDLVAKSQLGSVSHEWKGNNTSPVNLNRCMSSHFDQCWLIVFSGNKAPWQILSLLYCTLLFAQPNAINLKFNLGSNLFLSHARTLTVLHLPPSLSHSFYAFSNQQNCHQHVLFGFSDIRNQIPAYCDMKTKFLKMDKLAIKDSSSFVLFKNSKGRIIALKK
uniref:Uncharacterized protein n=1 Tax=Glossina palpalis gambiensis TaxID=67801 RepID=A0A1B0ASI7_9MUSC